MHIDILSRRMPIEYFKGSQAEVSKLSCIAVPEGFLNLSKQ